MMIQPGKTRIGWIGTGVMGASMCGHLIRAGFAATVFNRTRTRPSRSWTRRGLGRQPSRGRRRLGRDLYDGRLSVRRSPSHSRSRRRVVRLQTGQHRRRHDHQRTLFGGRNRPCRGEAGSIRHRRARLRRRRRCPRGPALDHDRRRRRSDQSAASLVGKRWARPSSGKAVPARANTPRWSTKSSSPATWSASARPCSTPTRPASIWKP